MTHTQHTSPEMASEDLDRARFKRALSSMDASDETIERIMRMAEKEDRQKAQQEQVFSQVAGAGSQGKKASRAPRGRLRVRTAVAIAATTALVASAAYAAVNVDFTQLAFSPKGNADVEAHTVVEQDCINPVTGEPKSWVAPSRTWADVDEQVAERLLDGYGFDAGLTAESHGYTLTVGQCVMDENGNGIAAITIENPDGVDIADAGYGEVYLSNDAPVFELVQSPDGESPWDVRIVRDTEASTDTKLVGAAYFGPFRATIGEGLVWSLVSREDGGQSSVQASNAAGESTYLLATTLPAKEFKGNDGSTVELSPIGMVQHPASVDQHIREMVIRFTDGTEYTVYRWGVDDPVDNTVLGYGYGWENEDDCARVFNRLVDVDAVESVVLRGVIRVDDPNDEQEFETALSAA